MRASVLNPFVDVEPGDPVDVRIEVVNTLDIVDLISLSVPELDASEVHFDRPSVSLFPDEQAVVKMTLRLRKTFPAGSGIIHVQVASTIRPDMVEVRPIEVDVAPVAEASMAVLPQAIVGKSTATITASLINSGNTALNVALIAKDDQRHLRFELFPPSLLLLPGAEAEVVVEGKGRRPFFGAPAYRSVYISAESEAGLLDDTVTFTQRPVFVRGLLTALILAAIVALWATIVTVGVDFVLNNEPAPKAVPADFASPVSFSQLASVGSAGAVGGSRSGAVAAVLGSMTGSVVGVDSGEPIPRMAVEVHRRSRRTPDAVLGSEDTRVQSAATDGTGTFSMSGIFPGTYFLKLVGPGFDESWYRSSPTADGADPIELSAGEDLELDEVRVAGRPGTLSGTIDAGDQTAPITVVIRPVVNEVPGFEVARVQVTPPDTDGDGFADEPARYEIPGLASPLTYNISVSADAFADQVITEVLDAGESLEAAPIRLVPGDGGIFGTVVLIGPPPTAAVTVTATFGETVFTVETPRPTPDTNDGSRSTVGFSFAGLPSPGTYSLRFETPGYEARSTSVDLTAGQVGDAGEIVLSGGSRVFFGSVVDPSSGLFLGEVEVTVLGGDAPISTTTLPAPTSPGTATAGDCRTPAPVADDASASGAGTFRFDNLPLGILSITFAKEGYTSVTHRIDVTGDGSPTPLTAGIADRVVDLSSTVGEVCGVVRAPNGTGIAGGSVALRGGPRPVDGSTEERMPTPLASDPAGAYKITDLGAGEYTLTATAEGFRDCTVVLRVGVGPRDARQRLLDITMVTTGAPENESCTISETRP